jgi:hypothetical protein
MIGSDPPIPERLPPLPWLTIFLAALVLAFTVEHIFLIVINDRDPHTVIEACPPGRAVKP